MAEPPGGPGQAPEPPAGRVPRERPRGTVPLVVGGLAGLLVLATLVFGSLVLVRETGEGPMPPASEKAGAPEAPLPRGLYPAPAGPAEGLRTPADPPQDVGTAIEKRLRQLEEADAAFARQAAELAAVLAALDGTSTDLPALAARMREGLLLEVTRRRLGRGIPLGDLEPKLARSYALRDPEAMVALMAWSREPVAPADLARRLAALRDAPEPLAVPGPDAPVIERLRSWFGSLVRVRRAAAASPARLDAAIDAVQTGDIARAVGLLEPAAGDGRVQRWLADARRVAAAEAALERLELRLIEDVPDPPLAGAVGRGPGSTAAGG